MDSDLAWFVVALIVAAAVSAATVGAKAASGAYSGSSGAQANDAFGDWFKNTITGWVGGLVTGGVANAAGGGDAASAGTDPGMYAGVTDAALESTTAAELAKVGVKEAGTQATQQVATEAAMQGVEQGAIQATEAGATDALLGPESGVMEASQGFGEGTQTFADNQLADLSNQSQQVLAEPEPGLFDSVTKMFSDLYESPTESFLKMLGVDDASLAEYTANTEYDDITKIAMGEMDGNSEEVEAQRKQAQALLDAQRAQLYSQNNPFGEQALTQFDLASQGQQVQMADYFGQQEFNAMGGGGFQGGNMISPMEQPDMDYMSSGDFMTPFDNEQSASSLFSILGGDDPFGVEEEQSDYWDDFGNTNTMFNY